MNATKKISIGLVFIFCTTFSAAQNSIQNRWFGPLKVGDKMPDIPLGEVANNYSGKARFTNFKGKLVILDMWSTYCSSCIVSFPKMKKLQEEFGDEIQIFLVNPFETKKEVEARLQTKQLEKYRHLFPDLPSITNAKLIKELFQIQTVPYHVWIDGNGFVQAMGSQYSTNSDNIRDFLSGKPITFLRASNTSTGDVKKPYKLIPDNRLAIQTGSFFSSFNNMYPPEGSSYNYEDSFVVRNTYINSQIVSLYFTVFQKAINKQRSTILYAPYNDWKDNMLLLVEDTLAYTSEFKPGILKTDKDLVKSGFCYEQITPAFMQQGKRQQYMLEDLNRYFGDLYGASGSLEKRKISAYVLVRISSEDRISNSGKPAPPTVVTVNGKKMVKWRTTSIALALQGTIRTSGLSKHFIKQDNNHPKYILDETGFSSRCYELLLPEASDLSSIEDLRKALLPYGLDIVKAERELDFIVISEKRARDE